MLFALWDVVVNWEKKIWHQIHHKVTNCDDDENFFFLFTLNSNIKTENFLILKRECKNNMFSVFDWPLLNCTSHNEANVDDISILLCMDEYLKCNTTHYRNFLSIRETINQKLFVLWMEVVKRKGKIGRLDDFWVDSTLFLGRLLNCLLRMVNYRK